MSTAKCQLQNVNFANFGRFFTNCPLKAHLALARFNNRLEEFKNDITAKKLKSRHCIGRCLYQYDDDDDDEKIPYQIGEVFVSLTQRSSGNFGQN